MMSHQQLLLAIDDLNEALAPLRFSEPVSHVYNPLVYARSGYEAYLDLAGAGPKRAFFLGMNPGPWGMAQTGVPFGEAAIVRDWMRIATEIGKPEPEHPRRPILGFACPRAEVSGGRVWGAVREHFQTPERFFERYFVANYCPLVFMEASGRNRTPDKLPARERQALFEACDRHLRRVVEILRPEWVIGIGAFAEQRAAIALAGSGVSIGRILHPSPANPATNRGWAKVAARELSDLGLCPL